MDHHIGTQRRATVITVTVTVAALAKALGIEGMTFLRIPSYGGRGDQIQLPYRN